MDVTTTPGYRAWLLFQLREAHRLPSFFDDAKIAAALRVDRIVPVDLVRRDRDRLARPSGFCDACGRWVPLGCRDCFERRPWPSMPTTSQVAAILVARGSVYPAWLKRSAIVRAFGLTARAVVAIERGLPRWPAICLGCGRLGRGVCLACAIR